MSQFLIRYVIYEGDQSPEEIFFRTIIFKIFNRIETWQCLVAALGEVRYADYDFDRYDKLLSALQNRSTVYSAAYIMPAAGVFGHARKHSNHLRLLEMMMENAAPLRVAECRSMHDAFEVLRSYPSIGDFLAYQYVTDLNYSTMTNFSEMEFVVPGPGARSGIRKCFSDTGGLTEVEIISRVAEVQAEEFARRHHTFKALTGRPLQLIDCQNLFCEVDKYSRVAHPDVLGNGGRSRIKQVYRPSLETPTCWLPPKWTMAGRAPWVSWSGE